MKRLLYAATALAAAAFIAPAANAIPIAAGSVLNIVGAATFTPTVINTTTPAGLSLNTGSFSALINCLSCVTVNQPAFTYSPAVGTGLLFTVNELSLTATVSVGAGGTATPGLNSLAINAPATLTMTGFDTTPGQFVWTINQFGVLIGSFSATAEAVAAPEPASMALLGVGLLGLGFLQARRKQG